MIVGEIILATFGKVAGRKMLRIIKALVANTLLNVTLTLEMSINKYDSTKYVILCCIPTECYVGQVLPDSGLP